MATEQKTQQTDVVRLLPARLAPGREDDWFQLFDRIREESVPLPSGIQSHTPSHSHPLFSTAAKLTTRLVCVSFPLWDPSGYDEGAA